MVAVPTTVGRLGKEGQVIRINIAIALGYAVLAGAMVWAIAVVV